MATFPTEKPVPGGKIYAADLEIAYAAANKLGGASLSGLGGINSKERLVLGGLPTAGLSLVEIVEELTDGVYSCVVRYYTPASSGQGTWSSMANLWLLDATDLSIPLNARSGEITGSIVAAYWDEQRSAFVPTGASGNTFLAWALATAEGSVTSVDNIDPWDGSTWTGDDPLSVENPQGLVAESGQKGLIAYNAGEDAWQVVYFKGLSQESITAFQVDAATFKLQKKTRTLIGQWQGADESEWTDVHTGTDACP